MKPTVVFFMLLFVAAAGAAVGSPQLRIDASQGQAALRLVESYAAGLEPPAEDFAKLHDSAGQQRLVARQASLGASMPAPAEWRAYLASRSDDAIALRATLTAWSTLDATAPGERASAYLPADTPLRATVFPVLKPSGNSFVYDLRGDPAIFLYLDPELGAEAFAAIVAHELHHVGLVAACPQTAEVAPRTATLRRWLGGFGEGRAVLAAAGSPDVHPHAVGSDADRQRWDQDLARALEDVRDLEAFFTALLDEGLDADEAAATGMRFVNDGMRPQGPYYTVGWLMATTIERELGRARLIASSCRPEALLLDYEEAARAAGDPALPRFSPALLERLRGLASDRKAEPATIAAPSVPAPS